MRIRRFILSPFILAPSLFFQPPTVNAQNFPVLQQMDREVQSLYRQVQSGVVRVELPTPKWLRDAAAQDDPLQKWDKIIDPHVREQIDQQRRKIQTTGQPPRIEPVLLTPTTRPASNSATQLPGWEVKQTTPGEIVLQPNPTQRSTLVIPSGGQGGSPNELKLTQTSLTPTTLPADDFSPNNLGLLLDDQGHILVPLYIEPEMIEKPVRVMVNDQLATATYVGADEKTNLTILKMTKVVGIPIRMAPNKPGDGSMVLLLNPNNASGRLLLWNSTERTYGVVCTMDGAVAGITRFGQFLGGPIARPVIQQIIDGGKVNRLTLGIRLSEVRSDDPRRKSLAALSTNPALSVDDVMPNSLAAKCDLKKGDLLLRFEDQPLPDLLTWSALIAKPGKYTLNILRSGKPQSLTLDLTAAQ